MTDRLAMKLDAGCALSDQDRTALATLSVRTRCLAARTDVISEGDVPSEVYLLTEGFACRYKVVENGARQIVALLVPGDVCDVDLATMPEMDHGIATITRCSVAEISRGAIGDLTNSHPCIARALRWAAMVDQATLREWLTSMGRRAADQGLAHLLCEMHLRLQVVGLADDQGCEFPLSQGDLADTLGLSIVHVNRSLQKLRSLGLIALKSHHLDVWDWAGLKKLAGFNPSYLHLRSDWSGQASKPEYRPAATYSPFQMAGGPSA